MDREEIIEKIENILFEYDNHGVSAPHVRIKYAHEIVDAIIPEGAVVLTREELETTDKIPQKIKEFCKWFIEIEKEIACKEAATKIRNYIKRNSMLGDYYAGECYDELDIWSFNRFLKENFGVGVE